MKYDPRYVSFGRAVAVRRENLGWTQADLASRVGMSRASIANIERGRQGVLLLHVYDLAEALGFAQVGDLLPPAPKVVVDDHALPLSDDSVSSRGKLQINGLINSAVAAATKASA
jgi:transcriptional regulator with XRE-family HTH domain